MPAYSGSASSAFLPVRISRPRQKRQPKTKYPALPTYRTFTPAAAPVASTLPTLPGLSPQDIFTTITPVAGGAAGIGSGAGTGAAPPPPPAPPTAPGFNADTDPIVAWTKAANEAAIKTALRGSLDEQERMLLGYGSQELARSVLGAVDPSLRGDPTIAPTIAAISDNPDTSTSMLARLARSYRDVTAANEDAMNKNNLFYSGYRVKRLGDLSYSNQTNLADAASRAQDALRQIAAGVLGVRNSAQDRLLQAIENAYNRWLQNPPDAGGQDGSDHPPSQSVEPPTVQNPIGQTPGGDTTFWGQPWSIAPSIPPLVPKKKKRAPNPPYLGPH
jgi:hypothetical protein